VSRGPTTFVLTGNRSFDADLFGVFEAKQELADAPVTFDLGGASGPDVVVFVNDLPADPQAANTEIEMAETGIQANLDSLDEAQARLEQFVRSQTGEVSFSVPGYPSGSPESQLMILLGAAEPGGEWDSASFETPELKSSQWEKAAAGFGEFIQKLDQVVGHYAWVETQVSGKLVVRSSVSWTGNLETAWNIPPTPDLSSLHRRTLKLALASRAGMLRTLGVVSAGAVKLSALVASPAGAILALPAAWSFIRRVQHETARYQSKKEEIEDGK
jgi:hypothetical protein